MSQGRNSENVRRIREIHRSFGIYQKENRDGDAETEGKAASFVVPTRKCKGHGFNSLCSFHMKI